MKAAIFLVSFLLAITSLNAQRVAPGVPPQHYQHVPQQQYHQQPPTPEYPQQQYQQPQGQVQYQQQPQGQFQQQPPHPQAGYQQPPQQQQHVPQQGGHGHGHPQQQGQHILNPANMQHEREHIQEHMDVPIDTSKMTEQELQFHYFKMHDSDNNNKLDGCELIKSLIHWHEQGSKEQHPGKPQIDEKVFSDEELVALIDPILQMDDTSHDGYIDYPEFIKAQQKAASQNQKKMENN